MAKNCCICGKKLGLLEDGSNVYFDRNKEFLLCDECKLRLSQLRYIERNIDNYEENIEYFKPYFSDVNINQTIKNVLVREITEAQSKVKNVALVKKQKEDAIKQREDNVRNITTYKLVTTGYNFEGYDIIEYRGLVSGEVVLGTGFLSEFSASFSDLFGSESNKFSDKIITAKEDAKKKMMDNVINVGGNAVIGVDFDYIMFGNNMIGVSVNGTAVVVRRIGEE